MREEGGVIATYSRKDYRREVFADRGRRDMAIIVRLTIERTSPKRAIWQRRANSLQTLALVSWTQPSSLGTGAIFSSMGYGVYGMRLAGLMVDALGSAPVTPTGPQLEKLKISSCPANGRLRGRSKS